MIAPQYLTEKDVAKLTKLSLAKLRQDRHKHCGIPYIKIGRAVRYRLEQVEAFMEEHTVTFSTVR